MCNVIATCYTRIVAQVSISYVYLGFYQVFRGKRSCSRLAFFFFILCCLFVFFYLFFFLYPNHVFSRTSIRTNGYFRYLYLDIDCHVNKTIEDGTFNSISALVRQSPQPTLTMTMQTSQNVYTASGEKRSLISLSVFI